MAMASRPAASGTLQTEAADDFVLDGPATIRHATFVGLLPTGAQLSAITSVGVEVYRVSPKDSTTPPSGQVPTRVNSPSDVVFESRAGLPFAASVLAPSFTAANSVDLGIHPFPNQTTAGEGPVTGQEVSFDVDFSQPISLAADHYFFVPQVGLSSGHFYWLSAPRPIVSPGTPFASDLQAWIRNSALSPDWLRVGTDVVGGGASAPMVNGAFSLSGCNAIVVAPSALPAGGVGNAYSAAASASGGVAPYALTATGALPAGISFTPSGLLMGTPTQAGSFPITIAAVDANGCHGSADLTLAVAAAGGPTGGGGSPPPTTGASAAPALMALKISPSAFRAAGAGGSVARRRRTGATVSFTESQAAKTTFTVLRRRPGVKAKGGICVRPGKQKHARRCTRDVSIGSFSRSDAAGSHSFHFTGRVGGQKLSPGSYRLRARASAAGRTGAPATIAFRIIR